MKAYTVCFTVALVATSYCSAIPPKTPEKHKDRVYEKDLSDQEHELNGDHNAEYDHDAFLGKDEAETFDQLSPEESKRRLGIIVDKIDKDKDGFVTEEELKSWIEYVQKRYIVQDTERMWADHQITNNAMTWESYKNRTYGYADDDDFSSSYKEMIERDQRRWKAADRNGDGQLSKDEFMDFLHPEEVEHMRDIVVDETIEDIDKDKDGYISLEEYIADIYEEDDEDGDEDDVGDHDKDHKDGEPDWVRSEREQFISTRDKNKDGRLDKGEVRQWIIPEDYNYVEAEATHLLHASDEDEDGKLSKQEILDKSDVFVGSQATEFGEALVRHDEF
ncbi:hypothetical protein ACJMK2_020538 [Sinanodonta woodiana]|uniref:Reticulocalbin-3 n=1 Tax=Sinanodonta woodiana TaxID=1069815 RepID=A0ABD3TZF5_SINWO